MVRPGQEKDMRISSQYRIFLQSFIEIRLLVAEKQCEKESRTDGRKDDYVCIDQLFLCIYAHAPERVIYADHLYLRIPFFTGSLLVNAHAQSRARVFSAHAPGHF